MNSFFCSVSLFHSILARLHVGFGVLFRISLCIGFDVDVRLFVYNDESIERKKPKQNETAASNKYPSSRIHETTTTTTTTWYRVCTQYTYTYMQYALCTKQIDAFVYLRSSLNEYTHLIRPNRAKRKCISTK